VACQTLHVEAPLEFFCVVAGGPEHESVLRTHARPSHIHAALLMIGLQPGEPLRYSQAAGKWFPPHGPALRISVEYTDEHGRLVTVPANKLMRDIRTRKPMPSTSWVFTGSRIMPDGVYAADVTGYIVSIVNFDLTPIDIPQLASNANETLEWQANLEALPPRGTPVSMILEPIDNAAPPPVSMTESSEPQATSTPASRLSEVTIDQQQIERLRARWDREVKPHAGALRHAAQAQYEVLSALRREQQRLIDEADRIQRLIDELERQYQEMTTPVPPTKTE
jgi:hypothetical protein